MSEALPNREKEEEDHHPSDAGSSSHASKDHASSKNDHDEDSSQSSGSDHRNIDMMKDGKFLQIQDLPQLGGQLYEAYGEVMMPRKLYEKAQNIEHFVDSNLHDKYKLAPKWSDWVKHVNPSTVIKKPRVLATLKALQFGKTTWQLSFSDVKQIFSEYGGKKKKESDPLSPQDRVFLGLLIAPEEFGHAVANDLWLFMRDSHVHSECVRLIHQYHGLHYDRQLLQSFHNPKPNKRFADMAIFISHFFGRAERVLTTNEVKELWDTLFFMNDFIKALEHQSSLVKEKEEGLPDEEGISEQQFIIHDATEQESDLGILAEAAVKKNEKRKDAETDTAAPMKKLKRQDTVASSTTTKKKSKDPVAVSTENIWAIVFSFK